MFCCIYFRSKVRPRARSRHAVFFVICVFCLLLVYVCVTIFIWLFVYFQDVRILCLAFYVWCFQTWTYHLSGRKLSRGGARSTYESCNAHVKRASLLAAKSNKKLNNIIEQSGVNFLDFSLWTLELSMFDMNIRFSVKFPPRGLILRSQFWNLGPNIRK